MNDDTLVVKETRIFNDDVMEVSVMKKEDACASGDKSIFIGSFTTALAPLKLYDELEKLGEQVLYYDRLNHLHLERRSAICTYRHFLRTNDRRIGRRHHCKVWIIGPKSYSYRPVGGKSECKNKGTKNSYAINQVLNCDPMLQHIKEELCNH